MTATVEELLRAESSARRGAAGHFLSESDVTRLLATITAVSADTRSVLDIGCGLGALTDTLEASGYEVTGIDVDDEAMRQMRAPHQNASIADIPFGDRSFDTVILNEVLEHLPEAVFTAGVREASRVAARHVIVTVPNGESLESASTRCEACRCVYSVHGHVRRFDRRDLEDLIPGFRLTDVRTVGPFKVRHRSFEWFIRRRLLDRYPVAPGTVCPQCLTTQHGLARSTELGAGSRLGHVVRVIAGAPWSRWWLIGIYARDA